MHVISLSNNSIRFKATLVALVLIAAACVPAIRRDAEGDGLLRVAVVGPINLDPARAVNVDAMTVSRMLYATLYAYDPVNASPEPELVKDWSVNKEQTQFTFNLRNVKFSDGATITAGDVRATLQRVRDADPPLLLTERLGVIQSIELEGAETVIIRLTKPFAELPSLLAHPSLGILPAVVVNNPAKIDGNRVTSGPFSITSSGDSLLKLEARSPVIGVERIDVQAFDDESKALAAFDKRKLDVVPLTLGTNAGRRRIVSHDFAAVSYYGLNLRSERFRSSGAREAVLRALDATELLDAGYGGGAARAESIIPRRVYGSPSGGCGKVCDSNTARAAQLREKAFGIDKPSLSIDFDASATQTAIAELAKAQLEKAGFSVQLREHPVDQYDEFLASGEAEIFRFGWVGEYAGAGTFLDPAFVGGAPENVFGFQSDVVDKTVDDAQRSASVSKRTELYGRAQREILDSFVALPIAQFKVRYVVADSVRSVDLDAMGTFNPVTVRVVN